MKRIPLLLLGGLALSGPAASAPAKPEPKAPAVGPPSKAVTSEIVEAIAAEMRRATKDLQIPGQPKPYHIAYKITEVDVNDCAASLGQTTSRRNRHFVNLEARVRVSPDGTPAFDNGNFVVPQADELDGVVPFNLPLEATPRIARRAAWLVTDQAYKEALIQLRAKMEARRAGSSSRPGDVASWTAEQPVVSAEPVLVQPLETLDELEARAKALSATFRDQPAIRDSRVAVTSYLERRWYLTTEGTIVTDTRRASGIVIAATGQADDGQLLPQYFLRYGHTAKDLPSDDELKAEAKKLSETIGALVKAPVMDRYIGPVLFEGEGAVGLIRATLAPHLGGTPVPEGLPPQEAKAFGGALTDKVGYQMFSQNLSIVDDPTAKLGGGKALIGGYKTDDEGVAAQRVEVVKDGMLKTLLTTRTPAYKASRSNGHARRTADGGTYHGSATNLFVIGKGGVPRKTLEQKLIAAARAVKRPYGLLIKRFDDAAITAAPEFSRRELVQMIKSTDQALPPPALLAYRVYPDGRRELVRGVQMAEVPIRAWKDVLAVGTELTTYNFLAANESQLQQRLTGGTDDGFVPSGGIESAIITPDLLLEEVDVYGAKVERPKPLLPKP
jgi:TldD protein